MFLLTVTWTGFRRSVSALGLYGSIFTVAKLQLFIHCRIIIEILEDCTKASGRERRYEGRDETLPEEAHTRITEKEPVDKYRRAAEEVGSSQSCGWTWHGYFCCPRAHLWNGGSS